MNTGKTQVISEERRKYYKLHPNQEKYPGAIIEMPSLPNDVYSRELWYQKGYKTDPQELMLGKELIKDNSGMRFNVTKEQATQIKLVCDFPGCGRECIGEFGLQAHKKTHKQ